MLPSIFTIKIGGKPTLVFEAKNLREAHELCLEQWLKLDLAEAQCDGAPLWDGTAKGWRCPTRAHYFPRPKIAASRLSHTMTGEQSRALKVGDRVCFNGEQADSGTVTAIEHRFCRHQMAGRPQELYRPRRYEAG